VYCQPNAETRVNGGVQAPQRKLSLMRPEGLVARSTRAVTSPLSIAARTSVSFSFSADVS
jgi:hypothetical protein